jgi:predicted phosphodiesterase
LSKIKKLVVAGDFHVPHHDSILFDLFLKFLSDFQPDYLVINGDFLDCFAISKFDKIPHSGRMKDELELGWGLLKKIRDAIPETEISYIEGNHEFRLRQYIIRNAPERYDIAPDLPELLELNQFNIEWVGTKEGASKWVDTYKRFGQLYVGHWDRVNKHSAMTAKNLVEDKGISLIQNHVHRGGTYHKRTDLAHKTFFTPKMKI